MGAELIRAESQHYLMAGGAPPPPARGAPHTPEDRASGPVLPSSAQRLGVGPHAQPRKEDRVDRTATEVVDIQSPDDVALADRMKLGREQILTELRKTIVGQEDTINQVLLSLFVGGNSLVVGVPGLAKTLLIYTLARVVDLKFNRIQFTPDLMPSDITGTDIIQEDATTGRRQMVFAPGPIFANIVLADEINRTPPKTQSALLEAMQEHRV